jgi:hypothetical protein
MKRIKDNFIINYTDNIKYNLSEIPGFNDLVKPDYNNTLNSNILRLNKIECRTNNSAYKVIRYDKYFLCLDMISTYGLCRSVILN